MTGVLWCQCTLRYTHGQSVVYGYLLSCLASHHSQDRPPKPAKGNKGKTERSLVGEPKRRRKFGKMVLTITIVCHFSKMYLIKKHVFGIQKDLGIFHFQVQECKANFISYIGITAAFAYPRRAYSHNKDELTEWEKTTDVSPLTQQVCSPRQRSPAPLEGWSRDRKNDSLQNTTLRQRRWLD